MMKMRVLIAAVSAALVGLSGCASLSSPEMAATAANKVSIAKNAKLSENNNRIATRVYNEPYIAASTTDYIPATAGNITLSVGDAEVYSVLYGIADQGKYSVTVASTADPKKKISVDLRNLTIDMAIKEVAIAAGYVAVIDHTRKMVTLADKATYTFRLPATVFQDLDANFSVSNAPSGGGGSGGAGGSAKYDVKGTIKNNATSSLKTFLTEMAGSGAKVNIHPESGLVSVRASATELRRVTDFMQDYVKDIMSQVEVKVSIIEVSLNDDMQFGIDWSQIVSGAGGITSAALSMGSVASPAMAITYTGTSIKSVITALEKQTNVKVVTEPTIMALNHSPTVLYDGRQIPYLGSVTSNVTGTTGTVSTSGSLSFATDGISLGVRPNIIDASKVELSLIPMISTVNGFSEFVVSGNTLKAPNQPIRQTHLQVLAEHGKTMIIGGIRSGQESVDNTGVPGLPGNALGKYLGGRSTMGAHKEMVILIHTNIIPAPKYNALIGESI